MAEQMNAAVYHGKRVDDGRGVNKEQLLEALWPGLVPDNGANHDEFNRPGGGRLMMALLHSGAIDNFGHWHIDALQVQLDLAVDDSAHHLCVTPMELGSGTQARCYNRKAPDVKSSRFGLQRLGVDFSKYPNFSEIARADLHARDIYYSRDAAGSLKTVIVCSAEEAKTADDGPQYRLVPHCQHHFVSEKLNALVSVGYCRVYLKDWRDIEAAWRSLLESFVVADRQTS